MSEPTVRIGCAGCRQWIPTPLGDVVPDHKDATGQKCPGSGTDLGDVVKARPGGEFE